MSTPTVGTTAAAKDAWALFWRIFSADKPRRMATLSELGLAPMQSMALMQLRPGEPMTRHRAAPPLPQHSLAQPKLSFRGGRRPCHHVGARHRRPVGDDLERQPVQQRQDPPRGAGWIGTTKRPVGDT